MLILFVCSSFMKFLVLMTMSPYGDSRLKPACDFIAAVLEKGHDLSVFFLADGVWNALKTISPASDEWDPLQFFQKCSESAALFYCEAAGARRGVTPESAASFFRMSSLAELSDLSVHSDRLVVF